MKELNEFVESWQIDPNKVKDSFIEYMKFLQNKEDVKLDFNARPNISYSLRGKKSTQSDRPLFTLIDVVDDEPAERWLSVCFYANLITDPEELGDFVPGGLLAEDAICFNLEEDDEEMKKYIFERLEEAYKNA